MNDQFLHRLREPPPLRFATTLKAKLDLRAAAVATRKRFLYLMSLLVIGGTALAFVSPSVRQLVASTLESVGLDTPSAHPGVRSRADGSAPSTNTASRVASPIEMEVLELRSKSVERPNAIAASPNAIDSRQPIGYSDRAANAQRAALISKHAQSLDADIAILSSDVHIRVGGAGATLAIFKVVGEEFGIHAKQKIRMSTRFSGVEDGFRKLCRGEFDIFGASRPILKPEMKDCAVQGTKFIELPIAYEVLAVIVNSNATWVNEITTDELKKMWEPAAQGKVARWDQINDAWPKQSLQLFGAFANSSSLDYFTDAIVGKPKATRSDYIGTDSANYVRNGVGRYTGAIGYVSYTSDIALTTQVKALKIVNSAGQPVSPSESAIVDASYTPLSRPLLMYVNAERATTPEIRAYVKFLLTHCAKWIGEANGVPLPADMYESVLAKFASGKAGTVFDGKSAIGVQLDEALARDPAQ